ncbi:MAG: hypothetical protein ACI9UR_000764 [Bacteroidia bacterium]|jgi:hypothetical protein
MAWLAIGVFSIIMGAYQYNVVGLETAQWFFLGALLSGVFYTFRRRQRKRFEAAEKNEKPQPK